MKLSEDGRAAGGHSPPGQESGWSGGHPAARLHEDSRFICIRQEAVRRVCAEEW